MRRVEGGHRLALGTAEEIAEQIIDCLPDPRSVAIGAGSPVRPGGG